MKDLDEFKKIWQQQESSADANDLLKNIATIDRKMQKQRLFMTISFVITIIVLLCLSLWTSSFFISLGVGFMILAMLIIAYYSWRTNLPFPADQHNRNNQDFVKENINYLERGRKLSARYMPLYALLLILGLNFTFVETLAPFEFSLLVRSAIHVGFSFFMGMLFYSGVKNYLKKYDERIGPLLEEFRKMSTK